MKAKEIISIVMDAYNEASREVHNKELWDQEQYNKIHSARDEAVLEIERLYKKLEIANNTLEKFCTKSNAVSMIIRADWRGEDQGQKDIAKLYDFQCEVEKELKENK